MSKKLPFVKSDIPRDLRMFLDRVRELVSGSGDDRLISADELASGVLTGSLVAPTQSFMAAPPAPVDVTATAAVRSIFVEWDAPAYAGHAYAEVWSASTNSLAAAVLLGMAPGGIYVDDTGPGATRYYWVRFVNTNDVKGPYNATSGVTATTMPELEYTMDVLAKEYGDTSEAPFFQLPNPLVIDGVTIAAGTYMKAAYIYNGVITNAKIANLAVDDAKIANLSVGKLTAGSIAADQYIQSSNYVAGTSGFRLDANGTAEFGAASIRGQVTAAQIDSRGLSIKDASGNIILAAGTPLTSSYITPAAGWLNSNVTLGTLGAGAFATLNSITSANASTYIANAAIGSAQVGQLTAGNIAANTITTDKLVVGSVTALNQSGWTTNGAAAGSSGTIQTVTLQFQASATSSIMLTVNSRFDYSPNIPVQATGLAYFRVYIYVNNVLYQPAGGGIVTVPYGIYGNNYEGSTSASFVLKNLPAGANDVYVSLFYILYNDDGVTQRVPSPNSSIYFYNNIVWLENKV